MSTSGLNAFDEETQRFILRAQGLLRYKSGSKPGQKHASPAPARGDAAAAALVEERERCGKRKGRRLYWAARFNITHGQIVSALQRRAKALRDCS